MKDFKFLMPRLDLCDKSDKWMLQKQIERKKLLQDMDNCSSTIEFFDAYCKKIRKLSKS